MLYPESKVPVVGVEFPEDKRERLREDPVGDDVAEAVAEEGNEEVAKEEVVG